MSVTAPLFDPTKPLLDLLDEEFRSHRPDFAGPNGEEAPWAVWERGLYGPLREFLRRPGKEFRARFVEAAWLLGGGGPSMPSALPLMVELLHAGSLIVDDIEDESSYRRGDRALHCMFGVPTALNAGNWLYFLPSQLLTRMGLPAEVELRLHRHVGQMLLRCHNGQAIDLSARIGDIAQKDVPSVVMVSTSLKTGALFELAAGLGAIGAGASEQRVAAIAGFGRALGVGLQMLDDLAGITNERKRHKGHEDLIHARPTWPWAWLAERLNEADYAALQIDARRVEARDQHPELLAQQMRQALGSHGSRIVHRYLRDAHEKLEAEVGRSPILGQLKQEITILERSYV